LAEELRFEEAAELRDRIRDVEQVIGVDVHTPGIATVLTAVGKTAARAGRSTPGIPPSTIFAVAMAAPVLPAVTKPTARPSRTNRTPT
jgi:hypothetical protein